MMSPSTYSLRFRLLAAFSFTFLLVLITHVLEDLGLVYVGKETADLIKEPRWEKYLVLCECGGKRVVAIQSQRFLEEKEKGGP